jgi:hypothetical protein
LNILFRKRVPQRGIGPFLHNCFQISLHLYFTLRPNKMPDSRLTLWKIHFQRFSSEANPGCETAASSARYLLTQPGYPGAQLPCGLPSLHPDREKCSSWPAGISPHVDEMRRATLIPQLDQREGRTVPDADLDPDTFPGHRSRQAVKLLSSALNVVIHDCSQGAEPLRLRAFVAGRSCALRSAGRA